MRNLGGRGFVFAFSAAARLDEKRNCMSMLKGILVILKKRCVVAGDYYGRDEYSGYVLNSSQSLALKVHASDEVSAVIVKGCEKTEVFAGVGYVPQSLRYDASSINLSDGSILLSLPKSMVSNDFNVVFRNAGHETERLQIETISEKIALLEIDPVGLHAGGVVYLTAKGVGLDRVKGIRLKGSSIRASESLNVVSPAVAIAAINTEGLASGDYTVVLETECGEEFQTLMTVVIEAVKIGPKLDLHLEVPESTLLTG